MLLTARHQRRLVGANGKLKDLTVSVAKQELGLVYYFEASM